MTIPFGELLEKVLDDDSNLYEFKRLCNVEQQSQESLLDHFLDYYFLDLENFCKMSNNAQHEITTKVYNVTQDEAKYLNQFCTFDEDSFLELDYFNQEFNRKETLKSDSAICSKESFKKLVKTVFNVERRGCVILKLDKFCDFLMDPSVLKNSDLASSCLPLILDLNEKVSNTAVDINKARQLYGKIINNFDEYEKNIGAFRNFRTVGISLFRTFAMFTGELGSDNFDEPLRMTMALLFIFFITITPQNLLNSMALIDTQEVLNEAELISLKKGVSIVYKYDIFFVAFFSRKFDLF